MDEITVSARNRSWNWFRISKEGQIKAKRPMADKLLPTSSPSKMEPSIKARNQEKTMRTAKGLHLPSWESIRVRSFRL
jgi:hypothetical protein